MKHIISAVALCCLATSCAELQVKRDLTHAQHTQAYKLSTASGARFEPGTLCAKSSAFKSWTAFEFTPGSEIYSLPTGINAAANCLAIPAVARAMEIHGGSKGGITYYEATAIHPSILFLDSDFRVISDLQKPRLKAGEGVFSGLGVSGIIPLVGDLATARYAVIYIHPLSTDGEIDVYTGYQTIPVPYSPYGTVKVRFFN